jgi:nitrilase
MLQTIKAAVVQAGPVLFDTPKTMVKRADLASEAAHKGADLVVFPEAFVGGLSEGYRLRRTAGHAQSRGSRRFSSLL